MESALLHHVGLSAWLVRFTGRQNEDPEGAILGLFVDDYLHCFQGVFHIKIRKNSKIKSAS